MVSKRKIRAALGSLGSSLQINKYEEPRTPEARSRPVRWQSEHALSADDVDPDGNLPSPHNSSLGPILSHADDVDEPFLRRRRSRLHLAQIRWNQRIEYASAIKLD